MPNDVPVAPGELANAIAEANRRLRERVAVQQQVEHQAAQNHQAVQNEWLRFIRDPEADAPRPVGRVVRVNNRDVFALGDGEFLEPRPAFEDAPENKRGEELFNLVLSSLREIYDVEGVIAGGAARDLAAGIKTHKDIDVFIPVTLDKMKEHTAELGWMGEPFEVKPPRVNKYKKAMKKNPEPFETVGRMQGMVQGVIIDLVLTKEPLSPKQVKGFPIHAQRCVWSLTDGLVVSPEAKKDIAEKKFTIDPTIKDEKYVEALKAKIGELVKRKDYKGWSMNAPKMVQWWQEVNDKFGKKAKKHA